MTVEFREKSNKDNGNSKIEKPQSPSGPGKPAEPQRKPECEKKHIRQDGKKPPKR